MRFLLDNNLSPRLAELLRAADDDVVHVRDIGMVSATDPVVIDEARAQGRVRISADTDFGTLLARTHATTPSFLLIRRASGRRASEQAAIILNNLNVARADLDAGAHRRAGRGDATHPPTSHRGTRPERIARRYVRPTCPRASGRMRAD